MINLLRLFTPPFFKYIYTFLCEKILEFKFINNPHLKKNLELKKLKKKKSAFIIATGPSIKKINLLKLKGKDCFTLSNAFLHERIMQINPIAHFFAPYHLPIKAKSFRKWIKTSDQRLPKYTKIIISYDDKNFVKGINKKRQFYFLKISHLVNKIHSDICKPIRNFQSGVLMMLPVLMFMGYKKIYLVGCDQNQLKYFNKIIENFYIEKKDVRNTTYKKKINSVKYSLDFHLQSNLIAIKQFNNYSRLMKSKNIKVINLSSESWLDMFEKKDFNNIVK